MIRRTVVAAVAVAALAGIPVLAGAAGAAAVQAVPAPHYPFPAHVVYTTGVVPSAGQSTRDEATRRAYDAWKSTYLVRGCASDEYYVSTKGDDDAPHDGTVSEAMGYGMTIVPLMAGYDADAKAEFDGMLRLVLAHRDRHGMMQWSLDGDSCRYADSGTPDSAIDGDVDIAYGMILADTQWGGYASQAKAWLAALWSADVAPDGHLKTEDDGPDSDGRPSDWILDHLRAFAKYDPGHDWAKVISRTERLISLLTSAYSPEAKLLPDFIVSADTSKPKPAPADFQESQPDNIVGYNSLRVPWRLGTDALLYGSPVSTEVATAESRSYRDRSGGDPKKVYPHDKLDGTPVHTDDQAEEAGDAVGPAAMVSGDRAWTDRIWNYLATNPFGDHYYGQTIKMIVYLVMASDYWAPGTAQPAPTPGSTSPASPTPVPTGSGPPAAAGGVRVSGAAGQCDPATATRRVTWTVTNTSGTKATLSDVSFQPAAHAKPVPPTVPAAGGGRAGKVKIEVDVAGSATDARIALTATVDGHRRHLTGDVPVGHACAGPPASSAPPTVVAAADGGGMSVAGLGVAVLITLLAAGIALILVVLGRRARAEQQRVTPTP